jgi:hypothetical protein
MRSLLYILSTVFFLQACTKNDPDCEVSWDCNQEPILEGYVNIDLTYTSGSEGIPVVLYRGYVEDRDTVWYGIATDSRLSFYLPNNVRYAAEAFYPQGNATLVALDGDKLTQDSNNDCGVTCYETSSITLNCKKN